MKVENGIILLDPHQHVSVEVLSEHDVRKLYVPLRYEIYHLEFGYSVNGVDSPGDFWDCYDPLSTSIGVRIKPGILIAAIRLVETSSINALPSGKIIARALNGQSMDGRVGELSRVMVAKPYRNCTIFPLLIVSALLLARSRNVPFVFMSEADRPAFRRLLKGLGFERIAAGFLFNDGVIAPPVESTSVCLKAGDLSEEKLARLRDLQKTIFESACRKIEQVPMAAARQVELDRSE